MNLCLSLLTFAILSAASPEVEINSAQTLSPPKVMVGVQMGQVETLGREPLGYELEGDVKVFRLIAQPVKQELLDGKNTLQEGLKLPPTPGMVIPSRKQEVTGWGFNGMIPGPTIEVNEGDRVRIIARNELPEPTSVHWHGLEVPADQDGAGGLSEAPIMPGEEKTYEFTLYQSGTYLYHSGYNVMKQDGLGISGMFIIHPKNPKKKIDKDFAIMLQEWALKPGETTPNVVGVKSNWYTFNGRVAPSIPRIVVNQGDRVRIRFGNLSMTSHPIHIHGYQWELVGTQMPVPPSASTWDSTVNVPPGSARDVEFVAWNPGVFRLHCHKLHHIVNPPISQPVGIVPPGGMLTYIQVIPKDPGAPWSPPPAKQ